MIVSFPLNLYSKELRHFNPNIFGKSVDEQVTLLLPDESKEAILPYLISTDVDIKKGIYFAAAKGRLPRDVSLRCRFDFPSFNIRDIEAEARAWAVVKQSGAMSASTFDSKFGLDYEKEMEQMRKESEDGG